MATNHALSEKIAEAAKTVRWPLDPASSPPMHFQPLNHMRDIRTASLSPHCPSCYLLPMDVLGVVAYLDTDKNDPSKQYMARIATALILLGHGMADEAHDLVSALSWPKELDFAHGPPVATSGAVLAYASYTHCLVHRREGPHDSEFGMTGYANSDYWAGAALRSGGEEALPLQEIRRAIEQLASTDRASQEWFRDKYRLVEEWDPRFLTELCRQVTQEQEGYAKFRTFAEQAAEVELRIILQYTLSILGFS